MQVRRQLQDIRQGPNESMYDYLEKFNALEQSCCNLGVPEKLIIEFLLDGLRPLDRMLLDASAGGTILNPSPAGVRKMILEVAENARFREEADRQDEFSRSKNVSRAEVAPASDELKELKQMVKMLVTNQVAQMKACEFCLAIDHRTDSCLGLQEEYGDVNVVGGYQNYDNNPQQQKFELAANEFSWRDNSNNTTKEPAQLHQQPQQQQYYRLPYRQQQGGAPVSRKEDIVKELAASTQQLATTVAKNKGAITELSKQMSQIATTVSELKNDPGRLPSQTIPNPKGNVDAVTLRSRKELKTAKRSQHQCPLCQQ
ncbi:unnamed protein product [Rhodiola kirilowii]